MPKNDYAFVWDNPTLGRGYLQVHILASIGPTKNMAYQTPGLTESPILLLDQIFHFNNQKYMYNLTFLDCKV